MGNSSVVRYCQLFDPNKTIEYRCNRGTSGIDGSTSTAIGAAFINPEKEHVLLCGDLSFFYDSNALWNKYLPKNLKIIVVNNHGGGIFRIIPGPSNSKQLETFFEAKHIQNIEKIASAFNCDYSLIKETDQLNKEIITFLTKKSENLSLMEIVTDSTQNPLYLQEFLTFITH
jgi:2-succinyl-5-enolpyruvyl-6-hydroxy-3-cyclohexene-1-carboxylate synthase